jgi:PqqD family protein of HPr-rel-A system
MVQSRPVLQEVLRMSVSVSPPKWKTAGRLLWHNWEDECAIYNTASGNTHIIDLTSAHILVTLEEQPCNIPELVEKTARILRQDPDSELEDHVTQLVAKFQDLDLIEYDAK